MQSLMRYRHLLTSRLSIPAPRSSFRSLHCSSAMSGATKACCQYVQVAQFDSKPFNSNYAARIPPIVPKGYQAKGEYKTINGLKTYVTGPESASKAILVVYDIFGFFDQTIQGADILSTANEQKYRVFMPDFFEGQPADISWFPPQTDEHKEKLGNFFQTKAGPPKNLPKIPGVVAEANKLASGGSFDWSILGFCWGGKITALSSGQDNKIFKAAVQCHPAMVDPEDAKAVSIPMAVLASKDEDPKAIEGFKNNLKTPNHVETFPTQIHGWMAARSNLEDPEVLKEYERGYKTVLDFFHKHA